MQLIRTTPERPRTAQHRRQRRRRKPAEEGPVETGRSRSHHEVVTGGVEDAARVGDEVHEGDVLACRAPARERRLETRTALQTFSGCAWAGQLCMAANTHRDIRSRYFL